MSSTRDQIIETTCELLEAQGYHGTGLNQILTESHAPKGSLYYHFPQGKEELVAEAIERTGALTAGRIRAGLAISDDAAEALRLFVRNIAEQVERSGFRAGGPLTMVAMETVNTSGRLNQTCRAAYTLLQEAFKEKLLACGYGEARATQLAVFINATIEGGIILSRTYHSGDPLRQVADELGTFLKQDYRG